MVRCIDTRYAPSNAMQFIIINYTGPFELREALGAKCIVMRGKYALRIYNGALRTA